MGEAAEASDIAVGTIVLDAIEVVGLAGLLVRQLGGFEGPIDLIPRRPFAGKLDFGVPRVGRGLAKES